MGYLLKVGNQREADFMLNYLDFGILAGYVLMVLAVGCGAAWLQKRKADRMGVERDNGAYFLAARTLPWPIIGLSLFSTNISTVHIVALCEEAGLCQL